jgi:hypothetical protein
MRDQAELSTRELAVHVLVYSMGFTLFAMEAVYGAVVSAFASKFVESRFIVQVITAVEHVIVVVDAVYITAKIVRHLWRKLWEVFDEQ